MAFSQNLNYMTFNLGCKSYFDPNIETFHNIKIIKQAFKNWKIIISRSFFYYGQKVLNLKKKFTLFWWLCIADPLYSIPYFSAKIFLTLLFVNLRPNLKWTLRHKQTLYTKKGLKRTQRIYQKKSCEKKSLGIRKSEASRSWSRTIEIPELLSLSTFQKTCFQGLQKVS